MSTARIFLAGFGTQTATIGAGGDDGTNRTAVTESWNGTSWTTVNSLNTTRKMASGFGTQTAGAIAGGNIPSGATTGATEIWNGTSWTSNPTSLTTARQQAAAGGIQTAGIYFGGSVPPVSAATEVFTGLKTQTITVS
jgi:hypothetical protein